MARDLSFWRNTESLELENKEIYSLLSDGKIVKGIGNLPTDKILSDIKQAFSGWLNNDNVYFESGDETFEIMITEQFVRFDCYSVSEYNMNKIIDIMLEYECPLYDSAIDVRFEG